MKSKSLTQQKAVSNTVDDGANSSLNNKLIVKLFRSFIMLCLFILINNISFANNLVISNVLLTGQNTTSHYSMVKFDIAWENSWRVSTGPSNWDAAWVFIKYRKKNSTEWNHATLHYVDGTGSGDGHTEPTNSDINSANDNGSSGAYGVFIHRNSNMTQGSVSYTGVRLRWDYGVDGLQDNDNVEVCVLGIEMVYVPQGSFYLGSGGSENYHFYKYPTSTNPYQVSSEAAITVGTTNDNLYYAGGTNAGDQAGPIPTVFPKGYAAFYCMKYKITQKQYTEFLNKLTSTQDGTRYYNKNSYRHSIGGSAGNRTTTMPYVACNYLNWADLVAYLDWAALRPMTELEFEKACRGTLSPVANEYAWGNTTITQATGISNSGAYNETASNSGANCVYNTKVSGPMRVGCLGQGVNTREAVGASYYGIMELSGNVWERSVTVGNTTGRAFTAINGDGQLDASGDANVSNWPGTNAVGGGFRGGLWTGTAIYLRVSDRYIAACTYTPRNTDNGGRGSRVAP